jgi:lambda family phage tail tape measure protein
MEDASKAVSKFALTIDEAAQGSMKTQQEFDRLGVSLDDLRTLSEEDLLRQTIQGLGNVKEDSERAALGMSLFGKSFRTVDTSAKGLAKSLEAAAGSGEVYARNIFEASELQDKLDRSLGNLQMAVLKAFGPAIELLTEFLNATTASENGTRGLVFALQTLGAILVGGAVAYGLTLLVRSLGTIGRGLAALMTVIRPAVVAVKAVGAAATTAAVATEKLGLASRLAGAAGLFAVNSPFLRILRSGAILIGVLTSGVFAAITMFDGFGAVAQNVLARVTEAMSELLAETLNLGGLLTIAGVGLGTPFQILADKTREARLESERLALAQKKVAEAGKKIQTGRDIRTVDTTSYDKLLATIRNTTEEFRRQNKAKVANLDTDTKLIGASAQQRQLTDALTSATEDYQRVIAGLREQKRNLTKEERASGAEAAINKQIDAARILFNVQKTSLENSVALNVKAQAVEQARLFTITRATDLQRELNSLTQQTASVFLPEVARAYLDIEAAAKASAEAEIAAEQQRRGATLNAEEIQSYYEAAREGIDKVKASTRELIQEQRKFEFVQFQKREEVRLNEELIRLQDTMAKSTMSDIEQKYYDIAAAARDSAKEAIRAEEARRGEPLDIDEVKKYYKVAEEGSKRLAAQQKKQYESSRTFAAGWQRAFQDYADAAGDAAATAGRLFRTFTDGLEDAIVDFVKTGEFNFKLFVSNMLEELLRSQIRETIAGLGKALGLGNLFGGTASIGSSASNPMYVVLADGGTGLGSAIASANGGLFDTIKGLFGGGGSTSGGGGGGSNILGSIGKAVGSIFSGGSKSSDKGSSGGGLISGIGKTIGSIASGIGGAVSGVAKAVGSIFSSGPGSSKMGGGGILETIGGGIKSLFSGFFANGGMIPQGRFGIAGEAGPELIGGPASVTPIGTNVTYNINAVDASSFASLLARDPSLIFSLSEAGRRNLPNSRR